MTDTTKVLGQVFPAAATLTTLYTVPAATMTTISSLVICNQSSTQPDLYRISIQVAAAADTPKQYLYYDSGINVLDNFTITSGWTLGAGDIVKVYSTTGTVSFNLFGVEVS